MEKGSRNSHTHLLYREGGVTGSKVCKTCKKEKSFNSFNINSAVVDGHNYECKSCHNFRRVKLESNSEATMKRRRIEEHQELIREGLE